MAVYFSEIASGNKGIPNVIYLSDLSDTKTLNSEFCILLEREVAYNTPFLELPEIKELFKANDIEYKGNYLFYSRKWKHNQERFVTGLPYVIKFACIVLAKMHQKNKVNEENKKHFLDKSECKYAFLMKDALQLSEILSHDNDLSIDIDFDLRNEKLAVLANAFKEANLIVYINDFFPDDRMSDMVNAGIDVYLNGIYLNDMNENLDDYLEAINFDYLTLDRQIDKKYFPKNFNKLGKFIPYKTSLKEYILSHETMPNYIEALKEGSMPYDEYGDFAVKKINEINVLVNGENYFDERYRRYPMHFLYQIDNEWKYISNNSYKYPTWFELFQDILFRTEGFSDNGISAKQVLLLVLNCNEICCVKEYWKHVAFVAKYDIENKVFEICDQTKGIMEFHKLLQKSTDLENDLENSD